MANTNISENYLEYLNEYFKGIKEWEKIVLTDLDWTLFRDSFFIKLYERMIDEGWITKYNQKFVDKAEDDWKNREASYDAYIWKVIMAFFGGIEGKTELQVASLVDDIIKRNYKKNYVYTYNKLKEYQKKGYKIIIVSGTPDFVIKKLIKKLWFEFWVGSVYGKTEKETFDGTNEVPMFASSTKIEVLNFLKETKKVKKIVAFGDTNWDLTLLQNANKGYAINPNSELLEKVMHMKKIDIIIERKDVIYDFKNCKVITK